MKKFLLLLVGGLIPFQILAQNFAYTYGGHTLNYTVIDQEAKTVKVQGHHSVSGYLSIPQIAIEENVVQNNIYTVVALDNYAFYECSELKSVTIPESVASIGYQAFQNCSELTSVTIPEAVTYIGDNAFYGCSSMTEVIFNAENCGTCGSYIYPAFSPNVQKITIGDRVKIIPMNAFYNCSDLTSLTIGSSTSEIGENAFRACESLTSVTIPASVTKIRGNAFRYCSSLAKVTFNAENCEFCGLANPAFPASLMELTFGDNVKMIPIFGFAQCDHLTSVKIPESVTQIGRQAFWHCSGITSLEIGNSVTEIGENAFGYCSGLTSITIPGSVTKIGDNAFNYCSGLTSITIPDNVTEIGAFAFCLCSGLTSVTMGKSVTSIGQNAFMGCSALKDVKFKSPDLWSQINFSNDNANPIALSQLFTVNGAEVSHLDLNIAESNMGDYSFYNAQNLTTVRVKGSAVGASSFSNCNKVTDVCLDVESLGSNSFNNCYALTAVYCLTEEPPTAPRDAFSKYSSVTLYVPVGSKSKYRDTQDCWCNFGNIIETDFAGIDTIFKADYADGNSGVESVIIDDAIADIDYSAPYEVYNLNGMRVIDTIDRLPSGIYIVRQASTVKKITIR